MSWVIGLDFKQTPEMPAWIHDYEVELVCTDDGWCLRLIKNEEGADLHTVTASTCTCGDHMWRDSVCKHILLWQSIRSKLGMGAYGVAA